MIATKLICHIKAAVKKMFYKAANGTRITFGNSVTFRNSFSLMIGKNGRVSIGANCFFNNGCSINCLDSVKIGAGTIFGENVKIYDHNHRFADFSVPIKEQGYTQAPVSIGRHCWLGSNVVVLKGAVIGDNCVIGAGCVIEGEIPDGTLVKQSGEYILQKITDKGRMKNE